MDVLLNSILIISLLSSILFLSYYKRFNASERRFGYFILVSTFFEVVACLTSMYFEGGNNLFGLHLFTLVEYIVLGNFMLRSFDFFKIRLPVLTVLGAGSLMIIFNSLFVQKLNTYNSYSIAGVKVFIIAMCVYFFYIVLRTKNYSIKEVKPTLYFFTAIFLNASTVMIWYLYSNELLSLSDDLWLKLSILKLTSTIIAYLIILIGCYHLINRKESDLI